jgi:septal ring factor EnvC (AmiA/AmiB activator)
MLEEGLTAEVPRQALPDPHLSPCLSATELHSKLQSSEVEVKSKCEELSSLHGQLKEARAENSQLTERIRSIEALLEAGQAQDTQVSHFSGQPEEREDSPEQRASHDAQLLHM